MPKLTPEELQSVLNQPGPSDNLSTPGLDDPYAELDKLAMTQRRGEMLPHWSPGLDAVIGAGAGVIIPAIPAAVGGFMAGGPAGAIAAAGTAIATGTVRNAALGAVGGVVGGLGSEVAYEAMGGHGSENQMPWLVKHGVPFVVGGLTGYGGEVLAKKGAGSVVQGVKSLFGRGAQEVTEDVIPQLSDKIIRGGIESTPDDLINRALVERRASTGPFGSKGDVFELASPKFGYEPGTKFTIISDDFGKNKTGKITLSPMEEGTEKLGSSIQIDTDELRWFNQIGKPYTKPSFMDFRDKGEIGNIQPLHYNGEHIGYSVDLDEGKGVINSFYMTPDGRIAKGMVPVETSRGEFIHFLDSDGKVVAEIPFDFERGIISTADNYKLSQWTGYDGKYGSFIAKQPGFEQAPPIMVVDTPNGASASVRNTAAAGREAPIRDNTTDAVFGPGVDPLQLSKEKDPIKRQFALLPKKFDPTTMEPPEVGKGMIISTTPQVVTGKTWTQNRFASPNWNASEAMGGGWDIVHDANSVLTGRFDNVSRMREWFNYLTQGIKSDRAVLEQRLMPVFKQYINDTDQIWTQMKAAEELRNNGAKLMASGDVEAGRRMMREANELIEELKKAHTGASQNTYKMRSQVLNELAQDPKNVSVRIALAMEDELPKGVVLSNREQDIVKKMRGFYENWENALTSEGIQTIDPKKYFHRLYISDDMDFVNAYRDWFKQSFGRSAKYTEFMSRVPNSVNWFPDLVASTDSYINTAAKKLAWRQWENKWLPVLQQSDQWTMNYWTDFKRLMTSPRMEGAFGKVIDLYRDAEYIRFTGLSLGTMIKHAFKFPLEISMLGPSKWAQGAGKLLEAWSGSNPEAKRVLDYWISYKRILETTLEEVGGHEWHSMMQGIRRISAQPTALVESVEHGISLFGSILKAADKNFNQDEWLRSFWKLVEFANFRGGTGHPMWMKSKSGRLMSMFQFTPHRIAESYGQMLLGVLRGKDTAFGESWLSKMIWLASIYGTAELTARANGISFAGQIGHIPYTSQTKEPWLKDKDAGAGDWRVSNFMPVVGELAYKMKTKGPIAGTVDHWARSTAAYKSFKYVTEGEFKYSHKYYDSPEMSLLGIQKDR